MKAATYYKGCAILLTDAWVRIAHDGWTEYASLYALTGVISKGSYRRPHLTSIAAAKRYIDAEYAESDARILRKKDNPSHEITGATAPHRAGSRQ